MEKKNSFQSYHKCVHPRTVRPGRTMNLFYVVTVGEIFQHWLGVTEYFSRWIGPRPTVHVLLNISLRRQWKRRTPSAVGKNNFMHRLRLSCMHIQDSRNTVGEHAVRKPCLHGRSHWSDSRLDVSPTARLARLKWRR